MTTPRERGPAPVVGHTHQRVFGLPVDREIIFSNHKQIHKDRIEKRQRQLIIKIPFLRPFLEFSEKILLVTTGHSPPTVLEKLGIGWLFVYLKRSLMVFTDRRIFHIPTTPAYKYRNSITQIPYECCESIQMKGRALVVKYKAEEGTEKFISLSGREKKKIRELLKVVSFEGDGAGVTRRVHLCPQCAAMLTEWVSKCRQCGLKFKSGTVAALLAILLPGGGYFYLRQPFLGMVTALFEVCAFFLIGVSVNDLLNGALSNLFWLTGGTVLLCLLKAFAVVHARVIVGEFITRKKAITFLTDKAVTG